MTLERYRSFIDDWPAFLAACERPEPTVLRVRTGRAEPAAVAAALEARGFRLSPVEGMADFYRVEIEPYPVSFTLEHWLGLLYVQQASTGVAAPALGPRPGERVLDLCSAPGGKTTHAADLMGDRGCLVASEVNEGRIRGLLGNVYRLGHTNVLALSADGRAFPDGAAFDRVLVDAPCSGEGTVRRRRGRPPRPSASFLRHTTRTQEALLRRAVRLVRPGGTILYVTCTFAPEENEAVVDAVLRDEPVELEPLEPPVPHARGLTRFEDRRFDARLEGAARVYPHHLDSGGLFLARLRRVDEGVGPVALRAVGEGAASESDASDRGDAWRPVPPVFPGDGMAGEEVAKLAARGREALRETFGVDEGAWDGVRWLARGGRLWLHTAEEWPIEGWTSGEWRPVSLGFRALEFDSAGRPRPTNDLLQWLGTRVGAGRVDLDDAALSRLLAEREIAGGGEARGLVAFTWRGRVLGRGVTGSGRIRSEIPKARAKDLEAVVEREGEGGAADGR